MDFEYMNLISDIIRKENITNNILYSIKKNGKCLDKVCLKHSNSLYKLIKMYSTTGFNLELPEPQLLEMKTDDIVKICIDDLIKYSNNLKSDNTQLLKILSELIEIKLHILKCILLEEKPVLLVDVNVRVEEATAPAPEENISEIQ